MIHLVFNRPTALLKAFAPDGSLKFEFEAGGDAWGNYETPDAAPYGHDCWCPPGHYLLGGPLALDPPLTSEGAWQIPVFDLEDATLQALTQAGKAEPGSSSSYLIGGIMAEIGQLAHYGRSAILLHGGGTNAPDPFAPMQVLCRTNGCTRLHNENLGTLVSWLQAQAADNHVIYTIIGDPQELSC